MKQENVRKTEAADYQPIAEVSIFGRFSTNIPFVSNESLFLGVEITNLFDKFKYSC